MSPRTHAHRALLVCGLTAAATAVSAPSALAADPSHALPPVSLRTVDTAQALMADRVHELLLQRVVDSTMRLERKLAKAEHKHVSPALRARLEQRSVVGVRRERTRVQQRLQALREATAERREARTTGGAPDVAIPGQLAAIAACESGGDPGAVGGGGAYRGKYQFSLQTWAAVGGSGDPAAAPEAEQDRRAAMLYATAGAGQWPVCGR